METQKIGQPFPALPVYTWRMNGPDRAGQNLISLTQGCVGLKASLPWAIRGSHNRCCKKRADVSGCLFPRFCGHRISASRLGTSDSGNSFILKGFPSWTRFSSSLDAWSQPVTNRSDYLKSCLQRLTGLSTLSSSTFRLVEGVVWLVRRSGDHFSSRGLIGTVRCHVRRFQTIKVLGEGRIPVRAKQACA